LPFSAAVAVDEWNEVELTSVTEPGALAAVSFAANAAEVPVCAFDQGSEN